MERPGILLGDVLRLKLFTGIGWGFAVWLALRWIAPLLYDPAILAVVVLDTWLDSLFVSILVVWTAEGRIRTSMLFLVISRAVRLTGGLLLVGLNAHSVFWFPAFRLICTILTLIVALNQAKLKITFRFSTTPRAIFTAALPFSTSDFLTLLYAQADIFLLSVIIANETMIGNYSIVLALLNAVATIPAGIYSVIVPGLAKQHTAASRIYSRTVVKVAAGFFFMGLVLWIATAVFSETAVPLILGPGYDDTRVWLAMISPILLIKSLNLVVTAVLVAGNLQKDRLLPQLFVVAVKVFAAVVILPVYQAAGLAWLGIICEVLLLAAYFWQVVRSRQKAFIH